ncbi:MAG: sodium:proton antiporter [Flavobacteriaceae bacterium]|jgi:NhaP-type Na+/H+ or K+/H+ antiporter|nr:sodium:proton antiporter [Flavobacteriaceae bacterium]NVJ72051.1 sodium:proton antiporter [Flavobacteriaceae bacterium]
MIELAGIIVLGIIAQWMAWRLKLPAILPLIIIGLLVGPFSTLYTVDGSKLIEPVWNGSSGLFPGEMIYYIVSLSISIILFEGGLTLKRSELSNVGPVISKLITLGSVVTFFGAGIASHYIFGLSWPISFLFSSLIIVTGPTVITPILRNIPLRKEVSAVLKWEGILIDPIGALVAVLVYEFISIEAGAGFTKTALIAFGEIILFGISFGFTFAHALGFAIKKKWIPHYLLNVVTLSMVLLVFVGSDIFAHESGLLAVVVMGMVLGNIDLPNIKELLYFKESLSVLLISFLFILLAANINLDDLLLVYNEKTAMLFGAVVILIRPLGVFLSSRGSSLKFNERFFISWVGPRGIVAAGIASLFGSKLVAAGEPGAEYITPLVFVVVLGTVLLNATTARIVAKWSKVYLDRSDGILIVGASKTSQLIAQYLQENERHVVIMDNNEINIRKAADRGLDAFKGNIFSDTITDNIELNDVGYLLAFTGNEEINDFALAKFKNNFGENGTFRLMHADEKGNDLSGKTDQLFSCEDDFASFEEVSFKYPKVNEVHFETLDQYKKLMEICSSDSDMAPIFIKDLDGTLHMLHQINLEGVENLKGYALVYIGKPDIH